ncbi:ubiquitin family protein [Cooperia oncophora]
MPVITFRTITQLSFTMDLEPTLTMAEVKKKIADEKGEDYAVELQKLIYNGKASVFTLCLRWQITIDNILQILDDATTIEQVDIDPNKFVVVMLSRRKAPEPVPAPTTTTAPAAAQPSAPVAAAPAPEAKTEPEPQAQSTPPAEVASSAPAAKPAAETAPQPAPAQQCKFIWN